MLVVEKSLPVCVPPRVRVLFEGARAYLFVVTACFLLVACWLGMHLEQPQLPATVAALCGSAFTYGSTKPAWEIASSRKNLGISSGRGAGQID